MLYDVTNTSASLVSPEDAQAYELLQAARRRIDSRRFQKDCDIIDAEIDRTVALGQAKNKLVFTKAGFIVGHSSNAPHKDVQHVWDSADMIFPSAMTLNRTDQLALENQKKFIGGLVRWRISLRPETWLVYRRLSGEVHPHTGKEITVSEYWINEKFTPMKEATALDLVEKFKKKR